MARGKQATLAANRRAESAHEVIDRLTTELAEAKVRARLAEARAARLENVERLLDEHNNDEALAVATEKLDWWAKVAAEDRGRRLAALDEFHGVLSRDIQVPHGSLGVEDWLEFVVRRYPKIMDALMAGGLKGSPWEALQTGRMDRTNKRLGAVRHLSDDSIRRFQVARGVRAIHEADPDRDAADVVIDILDATQSGFTSDDVIELLRPAADRTSDLAGDIAATPPDLGDP